MSHIVEVLIGVAVVLSLSGITLAIRTMYLTIYMERKLVRRFVDGLIDEHSCTELQNKPWYEAKQELEAVLISDFTESESRPILRALHQSSERGQEEYVKKLMHQLATRA